MSLTPKSWLEFQHYKDRSPIWIKLHRKLLDDFAFNKLPLASRALAPMLWLLASEYNDGKITASVDEIAFRMRTDANDIAEALKPLIDGGFFIDDSDTLAGCKQDAIPEKRERTSKRREETRTVAKATRPSDDQFEELKKAFPKRKGAQPWKPAKRLFEKLLKTGADPTQMVAALKAGVGFDRDKIGTEYIPRLSTWLSEERWRDVPAASGTNGYVAAQGTPEFAAWRDYYSTRKEAWLIVHAEAHCRPLTVPTRWPPGYQDQAA